MPNQPQFTDLHSLAKALKGTVNNGWINIAGPGHSVGDKSLGIRLDPECKHGFRVHSFAGDDVEKCVEHVRSVLSGEMTYNASAHNLQTNVQEALDGRVKRASKIWQMGVQIAGTIGAEYLLARGCLPKTNSKNHVLRFVAKCPFGQHRVPAICAEISDATTGDFAGIHRTAIKYDGTGKIQFEDGTPTKMMLGTASGAVVKLGPFQSTIGIAEGIETALSASILFSIPVWAALSAEGLRQFPVIPMIERLVIFADNDDAGQSAAQDCAARFWEAGLNGQICSPPNPYNDWNDYILGKAK